MNNVSIAKIYYFDRFIQISFFIFMIISTCVSK